MVSFLLHVNMFACTVSTNKNSFVLHSQPFRLWSSEHVSPTLHYECASVVLLLFQVQIRGSVSDKDAHMCPPYQFSGPIGGHKAPEQEHSLALA